MRFTTLLSAIALFTGYVFAFASAAEAKDIECSVGLIQIDKKSSWGIGGESREAKIALKKTLKGNFIGSSNVSFTNAAYKVSVQFEVGEVDLANTWSSILVALYKVNAGKNQLLGSLLIPNNYYRAGAVAPQEIWVGNNETLDKISNEPGAFDFEKLDFVKLGAKFVDGEVVGAMLSCNPG